MCGTANSKMFVANIRESRRLKRNVRLQKLFICKISCSALRYAVYLLLCGSSFTFSNVDLPGTQSNALNLNAWLYCL